MDLRKAWESWKKKHLKKHPCYDDTIFHNPHASEALESWDDIKDVARYSFVCGFRAGQQHEKQRKVKKK